MKNIDEIAVQPIEKYSDSKGISRSKPKTMFGRIVSSLISNIDYSFNLHDCVWCLSKFR